MKHLKKLTNLTLAALLAFTCYVGYQVVRADDGSANESANAGHFYVDGSSGWSFDTTKNTITISASGTYTISKDCTCTDEHSDYFIVISDGNDNNSINVNLTIKNVEIETTRGAAMEIHGSENVTLKFEGDNSFTSNRVTLRTGFAGIQFEDADTYGGSLEITSDSTSNTLTATGSQYAAGIGGGSGDVDSGVTTTSGNASNITISGGTVYANGYDNGAGIGGGYKGNASNITITGGIVYATGGYSGAGIGGGVFGDGNYIKITGGTVYAYGGTNTTHNSPVTYGAAIGGGSYGSASNITISGGTVTAVGSRSAAGIGGGYQGSADIITISGGTVTATGGQRAAGIGGGYGWNNVGGNASNIKITGGTVTATGGGLGAAGIGSGINGTIQSIEISGGHVIAEATENGHAIGYASGTSGTETVTLNYSYGVNWRSSSSGEFACSTDGGDVDTTGTYVELKESTSGCSVAPDTTEEVIIVDTSTR